MLLPLPGAQIFHSASLPDPESVETATKRTWIQIPPPPISLPPASSTLSEPE